MESQKKQYKRKKGEMIPLKTILPNIPISNKLLNWRSQSVNEILNQPFKEKKKFSLNFFNKGIKKGFLNNTMIVTDINKPNLDIFNSLEVLTDPIFKVTVNKTMTQEMNKNSTFKILLKENYTEYITSLKSKYPYFKFNHYKKINSEFLEYYKKYGEEGDINNRHFNINNKNQIILSKNNKKIKDNKIYKKSNLLEILGAQENIECDPKDFKIKEDFLSRTNPVELEMIRKDLQFKTGVIEKELEFILMNSPQKLYNYIENNRELTKKIKEYQIFLIQRRLQKKRVIKNYVTNSSKLITKGFKKRKDIKVLEILKNINIVYKNMQNLKNKTFSESENKIKQVNDAINIVKDSLKVFNNKYNKDKKLKCIIDIEKIIQTYENQGEENLNDQFNFNIKKLLNNCLLYYDKSNENKIIEENKDEIEQLFKKWNLTKENDEKNKITFLENDFNLIEKEDKIFLKYLLIYNNLKNSENNLLKLLVSILDMFEIIIKDNLDVNVIVSVFQDVFIKLVIKNFEIIQNITKNKLLILKIASNCFSIILSNYYYIIILIQNNFGIRLRIFGDVTELIRKEMDKNICNLVIDYYNDILLVNHWKYFIYETRQIRKNIKLFLKIRNINIFKLAIDKYKDYANNFNIEHKKEIEEKLNEASLNWDQKKNIDIKYQKMFDILYSKKELTKLKFKEIDITKIIKNEEKNNRLDYISITNEKITENNDINHKVSIFSLELINYIYDYLLAFVDINENISYNNTITGDTLDNEIDNGIRNDLIINMYKEVKEKLFFSKDIMINNKTGKVNNKQITEKETCIYYSDLILIQNILNQFLFFYPEQELVSIINNLTTTCIDLLVQLINETVNKTFNDYNSLDFKSYPIVNGGKGYNNYVNNFTILKRIYDNMTNCFNKNQINEIFNNAFNNLFKKINESIDEKGIIEADDELKQIRNEFNYIKKVLKLFKLVDCNNYKDLIDELIIKINPNKLPAKKKKSQNRDKDDKSEENKMKLVKLENSND